MHDVVFDAAHAATLARFWAAALDDYSVAPYDDEELARLAAAGIDGPEDDPSVLLVPAGTGPRIWCTAVPEPKTVKNRVHLDLLAADLEAETARLVGLGATVQQRLDGWTVLTDPQGNEFCLAAG
nr:VOC family protein [Auraticoccus cholistanensis]